MNNKNMNIGTRFWARLAAVVLLAMTASVAWSQTVLRNASVVGQGGNDVVRLDFSQPLTEDPTGFVLYTPARVALDLPGVVNALNQKPADLAYGNVSGVNASEANGRTRVVISLKRGSSYSLQRDGNSLFVILGAQAQAMGDNLSPATQVYQESSASLPFIQHVDFRRGEGGSGKVIVDLPSDQVSVDVHPQGQALVAEFAQTALAEGLSRRMDVTDFGTPVRFITSSDSGGKVRMVIDAQGEWEQAAYQTGRQFVIEIKPRQTDPSKLTKGQGYTGERLTLNFQSIDVRSLLQVIADFTNFNIITSDSVSGEITMRLKDVPWDQALDIILQAKNLGMRKNGSVLWIAPKDELMAKERAELEAQAAMRDLEPLVTRAFQLNYSKASDIAAQLTSQSSGGGSNTSTRLLSPRGSVVAEPRTNQIFVSDIPSKLDDVAALLTRLDKAMRQVMIEARIVVAEDTFSRDLGVRLGGGSSVGSRASIGSTYTAGSAGTTGGDLVNLPATSSTGAAVPSIALSLFNSSASRFLNLELQALEVDGRGKVVSSPRVMTADQVKALIEQGTEVPYQEATSSGATSVSFRKANLKLEVTPQITPEGDVILDLDINKDTLGQETTNGYAINTKHVKTQALVQNGGTIVIGGIFELEENESVSKVPLLGDIPGLGNLFKSRSRSSNKTELLVFITPRVLEDRVAAR